MPTPPPRPTDSAAPADWLLNRLDGGAPWVRGHVGPGFESYARVLHPLDDGPDRPTWADVAATNSRLLHPSAQWEQISHPAPYKPHPYQRAGRGYPGDPHIGQLTEQALGALCDVLQPHTPPDQTCYFAVWDGWGGLGAPNYRNVVQSTPTGDPVRPIAYAPDDWQLDMGGPTFHLPGRSYHLFGGALHEALRIGYWVTSDWFSTQSPNLLWPANHGWCVATEIDFDSTLVGGSAELIEDLIASRGLEVLAIDPDAPYEDEINN
jgi:hypothetical protein